MATNTNIIISARQPFLQPDGTLMPAWFRFLEALSGQANGQYTVQDALTYASSINNAPMNKVLADRIEAALVLIAKAQQTADDALLLGWIK